MFMFALNLFLRRFRNELARSLTNGNHFSSSHMESFEVRLKNYSNLSSENTGLHPCVNGAWLNELTE